LFESKLSRISNTCIICDERHRENQCPHIFYSQSIFEELKSGENGGFDKRATKNMERKFVERRKCGWRKKIRLVRGKREISDQVCRF